MTSSSVLRTHILRHHGEEYYDLCKAMNIPIKIKELETRPGHVAAFEVEVDINDKREPFTKELFLAYLLSWIIHDDQVSHR